MLALVWLASACAAEIGEIGPDAPEVNGELGASLAELPVATATARCLDLREGEEPSATSPEGDLWILSSNAVRAVDAELEEIVVAHELEGAVTAVVPRSDPSALVVSGGRLWDVRAEGLTAVPVPRELGGLSAACGQFDGSGNGLVVAASGELYQHEDGEWWRWTTEDGAPLGPITRLTTVDGACLGRSATALLGTAQGALELTIGTNPSVQWVEAAPGERDHLANDDVLGAAFVARGRLHFLDRPAEPVPAVEARLLAAAGGVAWIQTATGELLRRDSDGRWAQVRVADPATLPDERLLADATGSAWLAAEGRACRVALEPTIRVRGVTPFSSVGAEPLRIEVLLPDATGFAEILLDGVSVDDPSGAIELGRAGWHELQIATEHEGRRLVRTLTVWGGIPESDRETSWELDIQPLFRTRCQRCHAASSERDLSTYDAWVGSAEDIVDRVSRSSSLEGRMPPSQALPPDLLRDIEHWIAEGMKP